MALVPKYESKVYDALNCCIFRKTKEEFGGLSNMASGFPIKINNIGILSSEALYQLCRFPNLPEVQEKIIKEKSPMTAKMVSKPYRTESRTDWDFQRIKIMRWCLRVKLAQNFMSFGNVLESTFNKNIVEDSGKDSFWGAIRDKNDTNKLVGINALGRLLMELRQFYNEKRYSYEIFVVEPLNIPDFLILGEPITLIDERINFLNSLYTSLQINKDFSYTHRKDNEIKLITNQNIELNKVNEPIVEMNKEEITELHKKKRKTKKSNVENQNEIQTKLPF